MRALLVGLLVATLSAVGLVGCKRHHDVRPNVGPASPSAGNAPSARGGSATGGAAPAAEATPVRGKVLEAIDARSYTYLKLSTAQGEKWAAVPTAKVKVGDRVTVRNPMVMRNFESKTLKRKWGEILFGTLGGGGAGGGSSHGGMAGRSKAKMPPGHGGGMPPGHGGGKGWTRKKLAIKVEKAAGPSGHTVAELFAGRATLKSKTVTVRGQVTKFLAGIMGKNWMHLQDGTGSAKGSDYDLTVTTLDRVKVGDLVLVKGVVRTDQNLGAGYSYPVLLENATVQK